MKHLTLFFFAEFAAVALAGPAATLLCRRILAKLALVCMPLLVGILPLLAVVRIFLPAQSLLVVLQVQLLAVAFALAVAGAAALAGRRWVRGGPLAVGLIALLVLATPFWGDLLLGLDNRAVRSAAQRWLVAVNPLFTADRQIYLDDFDWTRSGVLYGRQSGCKLTSIGEDFPHKPVPAWALAVWYAAVGLAAAGIAGLVRQKGRASEYLISPDRFC